MPTVTLISDVLIQDFHVENVDELKRFVCAKLDRDLDWEAYKFKRDGRPISDDQGLHDGDEIRAFRKGRLDDHYQEKPVIQRPLLNPQLERPEFALMRNGRRVIGVYACERCDAPVVENAEDCLFCGYKLNWES